MKRMIKNALAVSLFAIASQSYAANTAATTTPVTPAERAKIEEVVRQYLISKPEVLVEAMQALQRKQYDQAEKTIKETQKIAATFANPLFHQANDPVSGNPSGKITVVEFFDYQCPHCIDMAPVIAAILKSNPNVRVISKEFPIRGAASELASRAALAANMQGKYTVFSHALLTANKPITQDLIVQTAQKLGLNVDQLKKDMNSPAVEGQLKNTIKLAQDLKLFGTPAFFIGKTDATGSIAYVPGQMNQVQLQQAIDKAGK